MTAPVRLTLSRRKGFDLQALSQVINGLPAVNVARPGPWGNPFDFRSSKFCWAALHYGCKANAIGRQEASVRAFRTWLSTASLGTVVEQNYALVMERRGEPPQDVSDRARTEIGHPAPTTEKIITSLRGKNLACWCKPGEPCHANALLEIANRPTCEAV